MAQALFSPSLNFYLSNWHEMEVLCDHFDDLREQISAEEFEKVQLVVDKASRNAESILLEISKKIEETVDSKAKLKAEQAGRQRVSDNWCVLLGLKESKKGVRYPCLSMEFGFHVLDQKPYLYFSLSVPKTDPKRKNKVQRIQQFFKNNSFAAEVKPEWGWDTESQILGVFLPIQKDTDLNQILDFSTKQYKQYVQGNEVALLDNLAKVESD